VFVIEDIQDFLQEFQFWKTCHIKRQGKGCSHFDTSRSAYVMYSLSIACGTYVINLDIIIILE
jgi:hypothetical protein